MTGADDRAGLEALAAHVDVGGRRVVSGASLGVAPGEFVCLLGPNGAGKTSLLRACLGLLPLAGGKIRIDGEDVAALPPTARARRLAYLPQTRSFAWPVRVRRAVGLGRFAHGAPASRPSAQDVAATDRALDACGLASLAARRVDSLSGGERARVHVARAFAAEAPLLLADEPVAALDPRAQIEVMGLIRRAVDGDDARGRPRFGALCVLHDARLAGRYADRIVVMREGRILIDGTPREALTPDVLAAVFGVRARILIDGDGRPDVLIDGLA